MSNIWLSSISSFSLSDLESLYRFFEISSDASLTVLTDKLANSRFKGELLTGVPELDFDILMRLDGKDLINTCKAKVTPVCKDDYFWKKKFESKYGFTLTEPTLTYQTLYKKMMKYRGKSTQFLLEYATKHNLLDIVKYTVSKGADIKKDNYYVVRVAAADGYLDIVKYFSDQIVFSEKVVPELVRNAAGGGHLDIVKFLESNYFIDPNKYLEIMHLYSKEYPEVIKYFACKLCSQK